MYFGIKKKFSFAISITIKQNKMNKKINKVEQIKNENGTFSYLFDGEVHTKQSKRDYSYCIPEIGSYSNSLKSIQSVQSFWFKNSNEGVNKDNLHILQIVK